MLELWPAIDIRDGRCVRLLRGDFGAETIYGDPVEQAVAFVEAGAERLHVVDLDAARSGQPVNRVAISRIVSSTGVPVQAGGGIRDGESASAMLALGVARVVIGTLAVERPEALGELAERWPGRVVAGLDHRAVTGPDGATRREVAVRGWTSGGGVELRAALARLDALPLAGLVVTDISRGGTGAGPDLEGLAEVLEATAVPLIASGGVGSVSDLASLARLGVGGRRLAGAIVGKALLGGMLSIEEALAACAP